MSFFSQLFHSIGKWFGPESTPAAESEPATVHAPLSEHLSDVTFASFNLPEPLMRGILDTGFTRCTPIQAETLPLALAGQDVMGQAQTGTGKTAAFLIAMFNRLLTVPAQTGRKPTQALALIIAPTRELAVQIHKDAEAIGKYTGLKLALVYGGTGFESQRKQLEEGVDVLIGTPGRTIDYFKQNVFDLRAAQVLVLDEADRMFDLGFIKDIRFLMRRLPKPQQRLSLLFSATLSLRVTELAYEHMNNPKQVSITPQKVTADKVTESVYFPANDEKIPLLLGLLKSHPVSRALVFVNTKPVAERVGAYLRGNGFTAGVLSGDVHQNKRLRILKEFTEGKLQLLVATDVAARGLHIPDVSHVFNFDLPQDAEDYVHRIGRTARAGAKGVAISFACETYAFSMGDIESYIGHKIPVETCAPELLVKPLPPVRDRDDEEEMAPRRHPKRGGPAPRRGGPPQRGTHHRDTPRGQSPSHGGGPKSSEPGKSSRGRGRGRGRGGPGGGSTPPASS